MICGILASFWNKSLRYYYHLFIDTLDRTLGDKRHLVTVELEVKPIETPSVTPIIKYAPSVSEDLPKVSQEAIENGIHSACLQGKVLKSKL